MSDECWGAKPLEYEGHAQQTRVLEKGQVCAFSGVSTPVWSDIWVKSLGFSLRTADPRDGLARVWLSTQWAVLWWKSRGNGTRTAEFPGLAAPFEEALGFASFVGFD
jgi:hypothetical protein